MKGRRKGKSCHSKKQFIVSIQEALEFGPWPVSSFLTAPKIGYLLNLCHSFPPKGNWMGGEGLGRGGCLHWRADFIVPHTIHSWNSFVIVSRRELSTEMDIYSLELSVPYCTECPYYPEGTWSNNWEDRNRRNPNLKLVTKKKPFFLSHICHRHMIVVESQLDSRYLLINFHVLEDMSYISRSFSSRL